MNKLRVIYITGVGDQKVDGQLKAIKTWAWYDVEPEMFRVGWGDQQPWQTKFQKLLARIDALLDSGEKVALVGVSAGASAAINAFAARKDKLVGVVCLSGKINYPEAIGTKYRSENPALLESVRACQQSLKALSVADRVRILSRFAILDGTVRAMDSRIPDARNRRSPTIGHIPTIALQITLGAPSFLRFLKQLATKS